VNLRPGRVATIEMAFTPGDERGFFRRLWDSLMVKS
jgi:hypothetical protein